jgi:hypothetical protein
VGLCQINKLIAAASYFDFAIFTVVGIETDPKLWRQVYDQVSLLATDDWSGYSDYLRKYPHATVDHHKHQYVVGAVHTNTIEGFWSIFKRGVVGTFHKVSAKYMGLYVAEFQFRYNNRTNADIFGAVISGC